MGYVILSVVALVLALWTAFVLGLAIEQRRLDAKRSREMERALEAVLLFYSGGGWGPESQAYWLELTGTEECTTRNLCDFVRKAYGRQFQLPSQKL